MPILLCLLELNLPAPALAASAEAADREHVLQIIQAFFDALANKNVESYRSLFVPGAQVTAARMTADGVSLRPRPVEEDLQKLPAGRNRLLERMWNPTVLISGRLAVVWTPYDFHNEGRFAHSGTDLFSLVLTADGWKIASLVYSVEPDTPSRHPAGPPRPPSSPPLPPPGR